MKNTHKKVIVTPYVLSGGAACSVVRTGDEPVYMAHVVMAPHTTYPEEGAYAQNSYRTETIYIASGDVVGVHNGTSKLYRAGEVLCVADGETYTLQTRENTCMCMVLVHDLANAHTDVIHEKGASN